MILITFMLALGAHAQDGFACAGDLAAELERRHVEAVAHGRPRAFVRDGLKLIERHLTRSGEGADAVERALREIDSGVFLLAAPVAHGDARWIEATDPRTGERASHRLFLSARGERALRKHRRKFGVSNASTNLENLARAGVPHTSYVASLSPAAFAALLDTGVDDVWPAILAGGRLHAGLFLAELVVDYLKENPSVSAAEIERELRQRGSACFLVAVPREAIKIPGQVNAIPGRQATGREASLQIRIEPSYRPPLVHRIWNGWAASDEANLERLEHVGVFGL